MKKLIIFLIFILISITFVLAQEVKINGFVNDYVNILNEQEKQELTQIAQSIYNSGKAEYSIVIINSTQGQDIESYAINIAQGKLGSKEKDNGLLLLVAIQDKQYRFEVGSGLEGTLNDAKVGRIGRDYLIPDFQQGNYGQGIIKASQAVQNTLNQTVNEQINISSKQFITPFVILIIFIIIFLSFFIFNIIKYSKKKNKHFKTAKNALIFFGATRGFKGKGGFGGSGGFGGFGGGGFSGGGSSGRW